MLPCQKYQFKPGTPSQVPTSFTWEDLVAPVPSDGRSHLTPEYSPRRFSVHRRWNRSFCCMASRKYFNMIGFDMIKTLGRSTLIELRLYKYICAGLRRSMVRSSWSNVTSRRFPHQTQTRSRVREVPNKVPPEATTCGEVNTTKPISLQGT